MTATKFTVDTPGFRKAAQMLLDWSKNKLMPPEVWGGGGGQYTAANTYFTNGKLVFYFSGNWQVQQFTSAIGNKFEWDAVPNPYGECGSTGMPGGAALVAFKATKNPKEVGKLVDWLTSEACARGIHRQDALPPRAPRPGQEGHHLPQQLQGAEHLPEGSPQAGARSLQPAVSCPDRHLQPRNARPA